MKKSEEFALPREFDQRLKQGIDRLKEMRETAEELSRIADLIQPLLGVSLPPERARAETPPPRVEKAVVARKQETRAAALTPPPPPSAEKAARTPPTSAPPDELDSEEIPEWRKLFPALSEKVPQRPK